MDELAKRAVACRHWRWMPGMKGVDVAGRQWRRNIASWTGEGHGIRSRYGQVLPDLSDPATLGCLLALVREAHEVWEINCVCISDLRTANSWRCWPASGTFKSEAAALVAALEAAP